MEKEWPDAINWTRACNIEKDEYHGGTFNGNSCRKLLKNTDLLRSMCPIVCLKYVSVLKAFNCVVESCYGDEISPDFENKIQEFKLTFEALDIPVTPKIHCVYYHVPQFCQHYSCGLGKHSEQASESVHAHFKNAWAKYKVHKSHPDYASNLLRTVKEFNCSHF